MRNCLNWILWIGLQGFSQKQQNLIKSGKIQISFSPNMLLLRYIKYHYSKQWARVHYKRGEWASSRNDTNWSFPPQPPVRGVERMWGRLRDSGTGDSCDVGIDRLNNPKPFVHASMAVIICLLLRTDGLTKIFVGVIERVVEAACRSDSLLVW